MKKRYCQKCKSIRYGDAEYCICGGKIIEPNNVDEMFKDMFNSKSGEKMKQ